MACCCKSPNRVSAACLGRCDLPKHRCLNREDVKPGPVPAHMGWDYTAKDAPEHQLRCGWRPGHISCSVLRRIEANKCGACGGCGACPPSVCPSVAASCRVPSTSGQCLAAGKCLAVFPTPSTTNCNKSPCDAHPTPLIRIVRHAGQYTICTKPSNINNHPSGQHPLKYVLNTDGEPEPENARFSVEAKYNDYLFDYTSSQSSFVLDFSPPDGKCYKPCQPRPSCKIPCPAPRSSCKMPPTCPPRFC